MYYTERVGGGKSALTAEYCMCTAARVLAVHLFMFIMYVQFGLSGEIRTMQTQAMPKNNAKMIEKESGSLPVRSTSNPKC